MKETLPSGQNVEANLDLLLMIDFGDLNLAGFEQVHDAPIEPREGQLDIKRCMIVVQPLQVVYAIDLVQQVELVSNIGVAPFDIESVLKAGLVGLILPD